jgi:uncharacterized membrane protein YphA (DoxX/SURF4 family)
MSGKLENETPIAWSLTAYGKTWIDTWDRFWFTPKAPHTLAVIRIATGLMLLYAHLVTATQLFSFVGDDAWINNATIAGIHRGEYAPPDAARSYLWHISNPLLLVLHHVLTIVVTACFAAGFLTRITAPLAWWFQLMLVHRMTGTLFGLDQVTTMLVMYLMLAPCGAVFSVDSLLRRKLLPKIAVNRRLAWLLPDDSPSAAVTVATRLIQIHLCIVYLFGGLWKARGTSWWDGTAIWFAISNAQYQSIDVTWIGRFPRLFSALAHITVFWEIFYCALVWPKLTRPIVLAIAVAVHGGIALFLGMITFGTIMIVANMAFLSPAIFQRQKQTLSTELAHPPSVAKRK